MARAWIVIVGFRDIIPKMGNETEIELGIGIYRV